MPSTPTDELVLVFRTTSSVEARSLAAHLEDADIEPRVVGDFLDGAYGGLNLGRMGEKEIWVAANDAATAEPLVEAWRREYHPKDTVESPPSSSLTLTRAAWFLAALGVFFVVGLEFGPQPLFVILSAAVCTALVMFFALAVQRMKRRGRAADDDAAVADMP